MGVARPRRTPLVDFFESFVAVDHQVWVITTVMLYRCAVIMTG
jgi:hypothetical protein